MKTVLIITLFCIYTLCISATDNTFQPEPIPLGAPRVVGCDVSKDLFDNGVYLKTACFISQPYTYDAARHKCAEYNMNLFIMNNEVVASHVMDVAQEMSGSLVGSLWVNGQRQSLSRRWQVFNIDGTVRGPLNSNIQFYSNHESGNCLRIAGKYTGIYNPLPLNCAEKSHVICEHFERTQNPPKLDLSKCLHKRDLYNYNIYLKSLCAIHQGLNYDEARRMCASNGMNLFMFDSAEVDEAFFEVTEDIMKTHAGGYWWVNGLRNPQTNKWSLYHANRVLKGPLYEGFEFVRLNGTNGVSTGDCLRLSGQRGPYQGLGYDCGVQNAIICEYNKNN